MRGLLISEAYSSLCVSVLSSLSEALEWSVQECLSKEVCYYPDLLSAVFVGIDELCCNEWW